VHSQRGLLRQAHGGGDVPRRIHGLRSVTLDNSGGRAGASYGRGASRQRRRPRREPEGSSARAGLLSTRRRRPRSGSPRPTIRSRKTSWSSTASSRSRAPVGPVVAAARSWGPVENIAGKEGVGIDLSTTVDRREYGLNWNAPLPKGGFAVEKRGHAPRSPRAREGGVVVRVRESPEACGPGLPQHQSPSVVAAQVVPPPHELEIFNGLSGRPAIRRRRGHGSGA